MSRDAAARLRLVVWDFDGTIADSREAIRLSASAALDALATRGDLDSALDTIGLPLGELFRTAVAGADEELVTALIAAYRDDFDRFGAARCATFDGVPEILSALRSSGLPCALATSRRPRSLDPLLVALGLEELFDPVVTDEHVTNPKPHPEMLLTICSAHGVEPAEVLMVGDTTFDMEMGRSAGVRTCAVTWGVHARDALESASPDHLVDSPGELAALVGSAEVA